MKSTQTLAAALFSLALGACATTSGGGSSAAPEIRADYDHAANFAAYKTFAFMAPTATEAAHLPPEVTADLKKSTQRQLESRGYRYAAARPDLLVNFSAKLAKATRDDTLANQQVGYYGYRKSNLVPVYKTYSSYPFDTGTTDYVEGTLNVEIVDAARSQLVWEGVAVGEVRHPDQPVAQLAPLIDKVVADVFAKYPFRASP